MVGFNAYVGPVYRLADPPDPDMRHFAVVAAAQHMNAAGTVHGGMLMTFADAAMGQTSRLVTGARGGSTVSMNCDFAGPARLGDVIEAHARVTRATRTLVFVTVELFTAGRLILVATGLWKIAADA